MAQQFPAGWSILAPIQAKPYFHSLTQFLDSQYKSGKIIYPQRAHIFRALEECDFSRVKVVILGQDPYHGPDQAIGLSFAVPNHLQPKPPSLKNILKELQSDLSITIQSNASDLMGWARQGVLLLNAVFTVEADSPLSHRDQGWEKFTTDVIQLLSERSEPMVFILWGNQAQKFKNIIGNRHRVIESAHPSPLSAHRGFFGSKPFSRANEHLRELGMTPIDWQKITD